MWNRSTNEIKQSAKSRRSDNPVSLTNTSMALKKEKHPIFYFLYPGVQMFTFFLLISLKIFEGEAQESAF